MLWGSPDGSHWLSQQVASRSTTKMGESFSIATSPQGSLFRKTFRELLMGEKVASAWHIDLVSLMPTSRPFQPPSSKNRQLPRHEQTQHVLLNHTTNNNILIKTNFMLSINQSFRHLIQSTHAPFISRYANDMWLKSIDGTPFHTMRYWTSGSRGKPRLRKLPFFT